MESLSSSTCYSSLNDCTVLSSRWGPVSDAELILPLTLEIKNIMATPLTGQQIIERFELYTDDTTDLSSDEELILANDKILSPL